MGQPPPLSRAPARRGRQSARRRSEHRFMIVPASLSSFFAKTVPALKDGAGHDLYPRLVRDEWRAIMRALFPGIERLLENFRAGSFIELIDRYLDAHPPRHWNPNALGGPFVEWVEADAPLEGTTRAMIAELADFHSLDYVTETAASRFDPAT